MTATRLEMTKAGRKAGSTRRYLKAENTKLAIIDSAASSTTPMTRKYCHAATALGPMVKVAWHQVGHGWQVVNWPGWKPPYA
jgi:hypothetical protein